MMVELPLILEMDLIITFQLQLCTFGSIELHGFLRDLLSFAKHDLNPLLSSQKGLLLTAGHNNFVRFAL